MKAETFYRKIEEKTNSQGFSGSNEKKDILVLSHEGVDLLRNYFDARRLAIAVRNHPLETVYHIETLSGLYTIEISKTSKKYGIGFRNYEEGEKVEIDNNKVGIVKNRLAESRYICVMIDGCNHSIELNRITPFKN